MKSQSRLDAARHLDNRWPLALILLIAWAATLETARAGGGIRPGHENRTFRSRPRLGGIQQPHRAEECADGEARLRLQAARTLPARAQAKRAASSSDRRRPRRMRRYRPARSMTKLSASGSFAITASQPGIFFGSSRDETRRRRAADRFARNQFRFEQAGARLAVRLITASNEVAAHSSPRSSPANSGPRLSGTTARDITGHSTTTLRGRGHGRFTFTIDATRISRGVHKSAAGTCEQDAQHALPRTRTLSRSTCHKATAGRADLRPFRHR